MVDGDHKIHKTLLAQAVKIFQEHPYKATRRGQALLVLKLVVLVTCGSLQASTTPSVTDLTALTREAVVLWLMPGVTRHTDVTAETLNKAFGGLNECTHNYFSCEVQSVG